MTDELCGFGEYDDQKCDLPANHDDEDHHRCGNYHWLHHEEMVGHDEDGEDVWESWDEPIHRLNGRPAPDPFGRGFTINEVGLFVSLTDEPGIIIPIRTEKRPNDSFTVTINVKTDDS